MRFIRQIISAIDKTHTQTRIRSTRTRENIGYTRCANSEFPMSLIPRQEIIDLKCQTTVIC